MAAIPQTQPTSYTGVPGTRPWAWRSPTEIGHKSPGAGNPGVQRPLAVPWPWTDDLAIGYAPLGGVSFPAGLVGVATDIEAGIFDLADPTVIYDTLWGVPDTLPGGYTANDQDATWNGGLDDGDDVNCLQLILNAGQVRRGLRIKPWLRGHAQYDWVAGDPLGTLASPNGLDLRTQLPNFPRLLLPDGSLYDYLWGPMCFANQAGKLQDTGGHTIGSLGTLTINLGWTGYATGWRNIRGYLKIVDFSGLNVPTTSRCQLIISKNADWAPTVGGGVGTTDIATVNLVSVHTGTADRDLQGDSGAVAPPDGTVGCMHARIEIDVGVIAYTITIPGGSDQCKAMWSPRCDVPMPFTVAGIWLDTEAIAPGGYLAGALTAPDLRPPVLLTGSPTTVDWTVNGDDVAIYAYATLLASTAYDLHLDAAGFENYWFKAEVFGPTDGAAIATNNNTADLGFVTGAAGIYVFRITRDTGAFVGSTTVALSVI